MFYLKREYIQNGTHHSGMWGCYDGLNPKFQRLCSKNEAAQAPTPPQNDEFCILDSNPPKNPTSHYGACHFGYNVALSKIFFRKGGMSSNFTLNLSFDIAA